MPRVLSYHDLRTRIGGSWAHGPASIDLPHGDIYRIPNEYWDANFKDRRNSASVPRDELLENIQLHAEDSMQGRHFYTEVPIPEEAQHYRPMFGMRSNPARNGLLGTEFDNVHNLPPNTIPVYLRTCGTLVETPTYSFSQLFLLEKGTKPLTSQEIREALARRDVIIETLDPKIKCRRNGAGYIELEWMPSFSMYRGGRLTRTCKAADFFEPCPGNGEVEVRAGNFYLGSVVKNYIGPKYLGWLIGASDGKRLLVHMNAKGIQPNTYSEPTMEIYAKVDGIINRKTQACRLLLFELTSLAPKDLKGTWGGEGYYNAQPDGPVPSGAHRWTIE